MSSCQDKLEIGMYIVSNAHRALLPARSVGNNRREMPGGEHSH